MARAPFVALALLCAVACAQAYVTIDSNRLAAEMKYWACAAEGETADVLLHVLAEHTIQESASGGAAGATCANWPAALKAVDGAVAGRKWVPPKSEGGKAASWAGCGGASCPAKAGATLKLEAPTYVRLLEFGHEQATSCPAGAPAAIDAFVQNLASRGCSSRVCSISDYVAARPGSPSCAAI